MTILVTPRERPAVILEDDAAIVIQDDDAGFRRG
jgi:hypothetical protein